MDDGQLHAKSPGFSQDQVSSLWWKRQPKCFSVLLNWFNQVLQCQEGAPFVTPPYDVKQVQTGDYFRRQKFGRQRTVFSGVFIVFPFCLCTPDQGDVSPHLTSKRNLPSCA